MRFAHEHLFRMAMAGAWCPRAAQVFGDFVIENEHLCAGIEGRVTVLMFDRLSYCESVPNLFSACADGSAQMIWARACAAVLLCGSWGTEPWAKSRRSLNFVNRACACSKNGEALRDPHACPFQEDVHGNDDRAFCRCCDDCTRECMRDV